MVPGTNVIASPEKDSAPNGVYVPPHQPCDGQPCDGATPVPTPPPMSSSDGSRYTSTPALPEQDAARDTSTQEGPRPGMGARLGDPVLPTDEGTRMRQVILQMEARDLPNLDNIGRSDPFVILYRRVDGEEGQEWEKLGQTETVYNNTNPKWATIFTLDFQFGANLVLKFTLYDRDSPSNDLLRQDYIGEVQCTLIQVLLSDNQRLQCPVFSHELPERNQGYLIVRAEEHKGDLGETITFSFGVSKLRKGRKPFYVLSRKNQNDSGFAPVVYSEVHQRYSRSDQFTIFRPITKSISRLVNSDHDRELQIQFFDYDRRGNHYRGGCTTFTLRSIRTAMSQSENGNAFFLLNKRRSNGQTINAGELVVKKCDISSPFSFLDYLQAGIAINTVIAVDMSNSNGDPQMPSSLHYNNPQVPNDYVVALQEVGRVLAAYTTTRSFHTYGFGAVIPPNRTETSHCFALTGNFANPVCHGVNDVIGAYYNALNQVGLYEPCLYGPVLNHTIQLLLSANQHSENPVYTILLLLTDGEFADFENVASLICQAADLPLSIVIVGVGNSNFVMLDRLDGDSERLCSPDGTPCARDIVQFVPFREHRFNPSQLAREVLDEIPDQLVSYMRSRSIKPTDIIPTHRGANRTLSRSGPYFPEQRQPIGATTSISSTRPSSIETIPFNPVMPSSHPTAPISASPPQSSVPSNLVGDMSNLHISPYTHQQQQFTNGTNVPDALSPTRP